MCCAGCLTEIVGNRSTDDDNSNCERQEAASHSDHRNSNQCRKRISRLKRSSVRLIRFRTNVPRLNLA